MHIPWTKNTAQGPNNMLKFMQIINFSVQIYASQKLLCLNLCKLET